MALAAGNLRFALTQKQKTREKRNISPISKEPLLNRWLEHPTSQILHHDQSCCDEARNWFHAYARSMEIGSWSEVELRAPVWLSKHFQWGPSQWPISWCQVVKEEMVDCGVFSCLAREIFTAQGHSVHPAQVLLSYGEECTRHWKGVWNIKEEEFESRKRFPWIGDNTVYHEICVIETNDGEARFYDSTWGHWLQPHARMGHGAILAVRSDCPRLLHWGEKIFSCGEWVFL